MAMPKFFAAQFFVFLTLIAHAHAAELTAPEGPMLTDAPGLRVGDRAPDFEASTYAGGSVRLSELYKKGPVVLVFYRGAWCPYCNVHLQSFQSRLPEIQGAGASVVAVSVDKPEYAAKAAGAGSLGFEVISDPDALILEAYRLVFRVPEALAAKYKDEYLIDLEAHSGRADHVIAVPATYIVDSKGVIRFAYADLDYKVRASPEQVLSALASEEFKRGNL